MRGALQGLLEVAGRPSTRLDEVEITSADPVLATRFRVGEAAAVALAACGAAAVDCWEQRTGRRQSVRVDVGSAAASLTSFAFQRLEGAAAPTLSRERNITDFYATRDGRWVLLHGGFPHLQAGVLEVLGFSAEPSNPKQAVADAVAGWDALDLEEAIAARRVCGAMVRSEDEWHAHPQQRALAALPVVEVASVNVVTSVSILSAIAPISPFAVNVNVSEVMFNVLPLPSVMAPSVASRFTSLPVPVPASATNNDRSFKSTVISMSSPSVVAEAFVTINPLVPAPPPSSSLI